MRFKFFQPRADHEVSPPSQKKPVSPPFITLVRHKTYATTKLLLLSSALLAGAQFAQADVGKLYNESCAACHDSGALNAIKKGDSASWNALIQQKGMDKLVQSVKVGIIPMPAGGLCKNPANAKGICTDKQYRELIEYMSK